MGGRGASSSSASPGAGASGLLTPLANGENVTKARKDEALYALAGATENLIRGLDKKDNLAEIRKMGTVRMIKDKETNDWTATTFGRVNGALGYYGLNVRTGKMIPQNKAENLYHNSRA